MTRKTPQKWTLWPQHRPEERGGSWAAWWLDRPAGRRRLRCRLRAGRGDTRAEHDDRGRRGRRAHRRRRRGEADRRAGRARRAPPITAGRRRARAHARAAGRAGPGRGRPRVRRRRERGRVVQPARDLGEPRRRPGVRGSADPRRRQAGRHGIRTRAAHRRRPGQRRTRHRGGQAHAHRGRRRPSSSTPQATRGRRGRGLPRRDRGDGRRRVENEPDVTTEEAAAGARRGRRAGAVGPGHADGRRQDVRGRARR